MAKKNLTPEENAEKLNKANAADSNTACSCGCGCSDCEDGCGDEENDDIVELVDDEGKSIKFYHVATIDYEKNWYVFFSPVENTDGVSTEEVVIFKLDTDEEGKDVFTPIEDEELLQKVYDEYTRIMEEDEKEDECCEHGHEGCCGCEGCDN